MNAWLRALVLALLGLCGTAPAAFAGHDWRTFEDGYQNLSGCYPADVFAMQPPALGAPEHFTAGDGAWATVSAQVNDSGLSPRAAMRAAELDQFGAGARPAYESVKPGGFVFSGYGRGQILYEKTILDGGLLKTLVVGYPNSKRAFYNNVARKMTACLWRAADLPASLVKLIKVFGAPFFKKALSCLLFKGVLHVEHPLLVLLCHKFFRSKICWQHGQRGSVREIARAMAMRTEVIEFGT